MNTELAAAVDALDASAMATGEWVQIAELIEQDD